MKYIGVFLIVLLLFTVCYADEGQDFKTEKDKISYSIGYQVGGDFKRQGMKINPEIVVKGAQDALSGAEPLMTQQEMRSALMEAQKEARAALKEQREQQAIENLAKGQDFLAENAKKEGVKTLPSGLQYKVIKEGTGKKPKETDSVTVHYRGTLIDGTEFDSSYKRNEPAIFYCPSSYPGLDRSLAIDERRSQVGDFHSV